MVRNILRKWYDMYNKPTETRLKSTEIFNRQKYYVECHRWRVKMSQKMSEVFIITNVDTLQRRIMYWRIHLLLLNSVGYPRQHRRFLQPGPFRNPRVFRTQHFSVHSKDKTHFALIRRARWPEICSTFANPSMIKYLIQMLTGIFTIMRRCPIMLQNTVNGTLRFSYGSSDSS